MVRSACQRMEHLVKTQRLVAGGFQRPADDFFRMAEAVNRRGVDPVNAEIEGAMDGGDGFVVVLRTPGEFPVAAADGPRAKADGGEVKVRIAEGAKRLRNGRGRHHSWFDDKGRKRLQKNLFAFQRDREAFLVEIDDHLRVVLTGFARI